tara:strand:- start:163 stop:354 length:192 start_codon:yes stop_codon:yes gene_type:complete
MEIRTGTLALATLTIVFTALQVWWIGATIKNGRTTDYALKKRRTIKDRRTNALEDKKKDWKSY